MEDTKCQLTIILARLHVGWRLVLSFKLEIIITNLYVCWGVRGEAAGHLNQLTSVTCFPLARSVRPGRYV